MRRNQSKLQATGAYGKASAIVATSLHARAGHRHWTAYSQGLLTSDGKSGCATLERARGLQSAHCRPIPIRNPDKSACHVHLGGGEGVGRLEIIPNS